MLHSLVFSLPALARSFAPTLLSLPVLPLIPPLEAFLLQLAGSWVLFSAFVGLPRYCFQRKQNCEHLFTSCLKWTDKTDHYYTQMGRSE